MTPERREGELRGRRGLLAPWREILGALMLGIIAVQGVLLVQHSRADATRTRAVPPPAAVRDSSVSPAALAASVLVRLKNVRFTWSDKIYVDAGDVALRALPLKGSIVNFDDLDSFTLAVQQSVVLIRPAVLAGMFNENIFNYDGSRVRDLKVAVVRDDHGAWAVRLAGSFALGVRVPFTMFARLSVDRSTNSLVIDVDHLQLLGFLPATKLIRWTPLNLDRLIGLPPNPSLAIHGNRLLVKPLGLFPPPRIDGTMTGVEVDEDAIRVTFSGDEIHAPRSQAPNYVYLRGGASQFGHFRMADTDMLIEDRDPTNPFVFSLLHYADMIPRSVVTLPDMRTARISMPDYRPAAPLRDPFAAVPETLNSSRGVR